MPYKVLNYWRDKLPSTTFINLYGPTEITCNCSFYRVEGIYQDDEPLPIGRPFQNTRMILLDVNNKLVTDENIHGEICVIGSSLALGYYNNETVTKEVFVQNPLVKTHEEKVYRTGDIGYYSADNVLMFSSRKDNQIKHMGHRIELGEIEKIANSLSIIEAGICIYDKEEEKLILFYQAPLEVNKKIYVSMLESLPKYMVPNKMIHFITLPLTNNAKIDRNKIMKEYFDAKSK